MNISYKWLKDLIGIDLSPNDLGDKLTLVGLEIDGMHRVEDDHVFDIEITSNRGDCLSHLGVAREISAFSGKEIKFPTHLDEAPETEDSHLVKIEDPDLCHRFTARIINDVKIGPSPEWLKTRLEAVGERPINNIADITNYVMHELGQPMHSFDLSKLAENRIVIRRAKLGETIRTLDEIERELNPNMLAICDSEKPIAVGGVMGGFYSSIDEETTDVLLEVACFDQDSIRRTSRWLNLSSEASYRFERGVDIENLVEASNRATELICDLADGTADKFVDIYPTKYTERIIETSNLRSEIKRISGLDVEEKEILRILTSLGIERKSESIFVAPSWRHDLAIEEDLIEEVTRIVGYDKVGEQLPRAISVGEYQPSEHHKKNLRRTLANLCFDEAISYSFIDSAHDGEFDITPNFLDENLEEKFVSIKDPIIEGSNRMRPSLLPGLLEAVRVNFNYQNRNVKLFEIGKVFGNSSNENDLPREQELLSLVVTGSEILENKEATSRTLDFFDIKGALDAGLDAICLPPLKYEASEFIHLQNGQSAELTLDGQKVGSLGKLDNQLSSKYKFKQSVFVAEIDLQTLLENTQEQNKYTSLPIYPSVSRDVSFLVKRQLTFDNIRSEIEEQGYELCRKVDFVDVFEGKGMRDDQRSITIRLEYRSDERTLTEEEVEKVHEQILNTLEVNLAVKKR